MMELLLVRGDEDVSVCALAECADPSYRSLVRWSRPGAEQALDSKGCGRTSRAETIIAGTVTSGAPAELVFACSCCCLIVGQA